MECAAVCINRPRRSGWLGVFAILCVTAWASVVRAETSPHEIHESFEAKNFDRSLWSIDPRTPPGLKSDLEEDALHLVVPPSTTTRGPAALQSKFGVEGDFDFRMDFRLKRFPHPDKEWTNCEIEIEGDDGAAAVIRADNSMVGSGYALWFGAPNESGKQGAWKQETSQDTRGSLRLHRSGANLEFWATRQDGKVLKLGDVDFGTRPIRVINCRLVVPPVKHVADVTLDNIVVRADRFTGLPEPTSTLFTNRLVWQAAAIVLLLAATLWWWALRRPASLPSDSEAAVSGSSQRWGRDQ